MSAAIKGARGRSAGNMGDPGLFGAIGGALKGAVSGFVTGGFNPISAVTGAVRGVVGRANNPATSIMGPMPGLGLPIPSPAGFKGPGLPATTGGGVSDIQRVRHVFGDVATFDMTPSVGGVPTETKAVKGCPSGYHPNKAAYYRRLPNGGPVVYIPKGHVCVKNRRRNSLNPRALDRAIGRINGAKRVQHKLASIETDTYTKAGNRK